LEDKILKLRNILLIVVLLLVSLTLAAFAPNPVQTTTDEVPDAVLSLLPIIIGALGVPAVNALKAWLKWSDPVKNLWLTAGASLVLSVLSLWLAGLILPMSTPVDFQKFAVTVFAVATLIYKSWPAQTEPTPEGASPAEQAQR
jgi:hypothetical protein